MKVVKKHAFVKLKRLEQKIVHKILTQIGRSKDCPEWRLQHQRAGSCCTCLEEALKWVQG